MAKNDEEKTSQRKVVSNTFEVDFEIPDFESAVTLLRKPIACSRQRFAVISEATGET